MAEQIMPGWEIAEDLSQSSGIILLTNGATTDILSITVPNGARLYIESMTARVVDAGSDQVSFSVSRNGMGLSNGFTDIPAVLFDYTAQFQIQRDCSSGIVVVKGKNDAAAPIRAVASLKCFLLREINKGKSDLRHVYEWAETQ